MRPIDFFLRTARRAPERIALSGPAGALTYAELLARTKELAAALQALAPDPRDRICICGGNDVMHVVALLATLLAGRIWVPLNPRAGRQELERIIAFTEPAVVLADAAQSPKLLACAGERLVEWVEGDTLGRCQLGGLARRFRGTLPQEVLHPLEETQAIKFTGGTTGTPKGVMQSYRAWNACIASLLHAMRLDEQDRYLAVAPITHGTSTFLLPMLACGGTVVLPGGTRARDVLDTLERERITAVFMPPTLIYSLLDDETVHRRDWRHLRHLVYSAAPMRTERIAQARTVFGGIATAYGQTEAPAIVSFLDAHEGAGTDAPGAVGSAGLFTRIGVMAPSGELLPEGEVGEIVVRGDLLMTGYWRQPDQTAQVLRDGWLHTGDSGYLDRQGRLYLKGRVREVIISGGFNVYPGDVEEVLASHPAVHDCLVIGIEDPHWGEAVHAAVQLRAGSVADEGELVRWMKQQLDSVKAPKRVHFFEELPRTPNGKLSRRDAQSSVLHRLRQETVQ